MKWKWSFEVKSKLCNGWKKEVFLGQVGDAGQHERKGKKNNGHGGSWGVTKDCSQKVGEWREEEIRHVEALRACAPRGIDHPR
jgi:hypothetical protein